MKITETQNPNQLIIKSNGVVSVVAGSIVAAISLVAVIYGLTSSLEEKFVVAGLGALFFVIGTLMVVFATNSEFIFAKQGVCSMTSKRLLGGKTKNEAFDASDVGSVQLTSSQENDNSSRSVSSTPRMRSRLSLQMKNGTLINIGEDVKTMSGVSVGGFSLNNPVSNLPLKEEADQIAGFFGVPMQSNADINRLFPGQPPQPPSQHS